GFNPDPIVARVLGELEVLRLDEALEQGQQRCAIHCPGRLECHPHRLDRTHKHRFRQVLSDGLNDGSNVRLHETNGDAVVGEPHARCVLSSHGSSGEKDAQHDPRHPPAPSGAFRRPQFFHGSRTSSTHVVSIPTMTTRPLLICFTRRPATTSPTRSTRDPSTPGRPSITADGTAPITTPTRLNTGVGGGGASCSARRNGS